MKSARRFRNARSERGESIVEGTMCILLICLILFGLLQIFYISVAQMFSDFSAFYAARSRSVGFADYLVERNGRVAAIGASGKMLEPPNSFDTLIDQFGVEAGGLGLATRYVSGIQWLEYEYWNGDTDAGTTLSISTSNELGVVAGKSVFKDYPLDFPMREAFIKDETIDLTGNAKVIESASTYLE